ncbi:MAG TPA: transglutaminase-like domain-containing protein [Gemmatimonadaceae bacterium]|nr:transglutaminase-like domain-containing protein [Gemmatimonadaceae bacterium]
MRRRRVRSAAATVIVIAWAAALAGLVQRDVVRSPAARLAELALRVNPGNVFYGVDQHGHRVGWASSTIDTMADSLTRRSDTLMLLDELVADAPNGADAERASIRSQIMLSRAFSLRRFLIDMDSGGATSRVSGQMHGDTALDVVVTMRARTDTQRLKVSEPVMLAPMVRLAAVLRSPPKRGSRGKYLVFDPAKRSTHEVTMQILAESLFVVDDSAGLDVASGRFVSTLKDTVRAWRVAAADSSIPASWVDAQGRVVQTSALGALAMARTAYELSFENWRLDARAAAKATVTGTNDVHDVTPVAADLKVAFSGGRRMHYRLTAPSLSAFSLSGGRQRTYGNVVTVELEQPDIFAAKYRLPFGPAERTRFRNELQAEPYLQTRTPAMLRKGITIIQHERVPENIVRLLAKWVSDSIARTASFSMPDAIEVLRTGAGDSDDHTQLFTALARSLDIPTRIVSGVIYVNGQFYRHSWAEVFLADWMPVDPTFGQVPVDVSHLRLATGGFEHRAEFARLLKTLHIDVVTQ